MGPEDDCCSNFLKGFQQRVRFFEPLRLALLRQKRLDFSLQKDTGNSIAFKPLFPGDLALEFSSQGCGNDAILLRPGSVKDPLSRCPFLPFFNYPVTRLPARQYRMCPS